MNYDGKEFVFVDFNWDTIAHQADSADAKTAESNLSDLHEMIRFHRKHVSTKPEFLIARSRAEAAARNLLEKKAGCFTENNFQDFFKHCNTERVPRNVNALRLNDYETHGRLRPAFMGNNKRLMLESFQELNNWTRELWESSNSSLKVLEDFWFNSNVKGAGISYPSMIMYLKSPDHFSIWLPFLSDALSTFINQPVSKIGSLSNYQKYNNTVDLYLRKPFGLRPQEIDYILFCVGRKWRLL